MASLLHQFLHDLRQRCAHLQKELQQLENLAREAQAYRDKWAIKVDRAGQLIDQWLGDPGLTHPRLVRNYYHDYKRLSELLFNVEAGPVLALKHFARPDQDITRIVGRMCQEIGFPYQAPLCVALSTQYYWAFPGMDLVFVPASEPFHLLALADLYHELAHFLLERNPNLVAAFLKLIDDYFDKQVREARQRGWPKRSIDKFRERRKQWKRWYQEFASDMLATFWVGAAFGWCNLRLCTNRSADLFEGGDAHPADDARHTGIRAMLAKLGKNSELAGIDARWADLIALAGQAPPAEYQLTYPSELIQSLAELVFSKANDLGLKTCPASKPPEGTLHLACCLNEAWEEFFAHPAAFAAYENDQINKIRTSLSAP
jgi:hypothetical protein